MKRCFSNIAAECWFRSPSGLGETRNCLCLQADSAACDVFLAAVQELEQEGRPAQRKLTLTGRSHPRSCSIVRLIFSQESDALKQMHLRHEGETAVLEFTDRGLSEFKKAIDALKAGAQDFCIHPDLDGTKIKKLGKQDQESLELWFWTQYMDP